MAERVGGQEWRWDGGDWEPIYTPSRLEWDTLVWLTAENSWWRERTLHVIAELWSADSMLSVLGFGGL